MSDSLAPKSGNVPPPFTGAGFGLAKPSMAVVIPVKTVPPDSN